MGEGGEENKPERPLKISRRDFLKVAGLAGIGSLLTLSGCGEQGVELNQAVPDSQMVEKLTQEGLEKIKRIQTDPGQFGLRKEVLDSFRKMVNDTYPGISLTFTGNPYIEFLRKKPLQEAILFAIAGLDLLNSRRYNQPNIYACNIYCLDLARALLGNEVIGDRYNTQTGEPFSFGLRDLNWENRSLVEQYNQQFPFFHGNNFDWWGQTYGGQYGWRRIDPGNLAGINSNMIGIYCTSLEEIKRQRERDQNFLGHLGVIFVPDINKPQYLAISQATIHTPFEVLNPNHRILTGIKNGVYRVYVHSYSSS